MMKQQIQSGEGGREGGPEVAAVLVSPRMIQSFFNLNA